MSRPLADRLGLGVSIACMVHCAAMPVLVIALPGLLVGLGDGVVHVALLAIALPAAVWAFADARHTPAARPLALIAAGGLLVMTLALIVPDGRAHTLVTLAGVSIVAMAHFLNQRRRCAT